MIVKIFNPRISQIEANREEKNISWDDLKLLMENKLQLKSHETISELLITDKSIRARIKTL